MFDENTGVDGVDGFGELIGKSLRASETLNDSFEDRLMQSVRELGPLNKKHGYFSVIKDWATEQRSIHISPIAGLAIAAGFAGVIALSTIKLATSKQTVPDSNVAVHQAPGATGNNVQMVQFVISVPNASKVTLVGDFNDWDVNATPLKQASVGTPGVWTINVPLPPGRHEYAFFVNGEKWVADPSSPVQKVDDFGKPNSVVTVGDKSA